MQMNDENIQTEEIKQAAEPEFKFPDDAESTSRPNETAEVVTRETAEETNTELLQSIDKKLDMLLAAQAATQALSQRNRFPSVSQRAVFQRMNMNISQEKNSPAVIQNESA